MINFINSHNSRNAADQRVHQLLTEKFRFFDSVFGASDEVLGAVESGVDFEKRVLKIYQTCRNPEQIETAFNQLQEELRDSIDSKLADTEKKLLDHFDEDVHQRLKMELAEAHLRLDKLARQFWLLTRSIIADDADWHDDDLTFFLKHSPVSRAPRGRYHLISKNPAGDSRPENGCLYRLSHPLGEHVIAEGRACSTPTASLTFDTQAHPTKLTLVEQLRGTTGYLRLTHLTIQSYEEENDLLFSAHTTNGQTLDQETCEKLFSILASLHSLDPEIPQADLDRLSKDAQRHLEATVSTSLERNNAHFKKACENIDRWADDMIIAAEEKFKMAKAEIRALRTQMRQAPALEEQHQIQEQVRAAERQKRKARNDIDEIEDEVE